MTRAKPRNPPRLALAQVRARGARSRISSWRSTNGTATGPTVVGEYYALRLPVAFSLELDSNVNSADCLIGQEKRGLVERLQFSETSRSAPPKLIRTEFNTWYPDGKPHQPYWRDGANWTAGSGSWALFSLNEFASFYDEPGFTRPGSVPSSLALTQSSGIDAQSFPIYYGGVGRAGHFEFHTFVKDKASGDIVRDLTWGMLIDYSSPNSGSHYFYL